MSKTDRTSCRDARRRVEFGPIWRARSSLARTHLACLLVSSVCVVAHEFVCDLLIASFAEAANNRLERTGSAAAQP
jgi:hypothetical protein